MFFCWGRKEKNLIEPKARLAAENKKKNTIVSAFEIPTPEIKPVIIPKKE
jgi:hypothetical protein